MKYLTAEYAVFALSVIAGFIALIVFLSAFFGINSEMANAMSGYAGGLMR